MKRGIQSGIIALTIVSASVGLVGCSTGGSKQTAPTKAVFFTTGGSFFGGFNNTGGAANCVGSYTGLAYITNSATGGLWFTPPAGTTNCTISDTSGLPSPYESVVKVTRKDQLFSTCGTNTVSFPVSSTKDYRFTIYLKNTPPPPTNGQVLTLDVSWQP